MSMQEESSLCIKIHEVYQEPYRVASNVAQCGKGSQVGNVVCPLLPQCLHSW